MINQKYLDIIKKIIQAETGDETFSCFIFGSSLSRKKFGDIDLGIIGKIGQKKISRLKEKFELSNLPFAVDLVDFNQVGEEFKKNVFNQKIIWIKR